MYAFSTYIGTSRDPRLVDPADIATAGSTGPTVGRPSVATVGFGDMWRVAVDSRWRWIR